MKKVAKLALRRRSASITAKVVSADAVTSSATTIAADLRAVEVVIRVGVAREVEASEEVTFSISFLHRNSQSISCIGLSVSFELVNFTFIDL